MPRRHAVTPASVTRVSGAAAATRAEDVLATEEPLEIRVNGRPVAVTMRTPGHDAELARGFLWTESIATDASVVPPVKALANPLDEARGNIVNVTLPPAALARTGWQRNFYTTSSCGVCGKGSIEAIAVQHPRVESAMRVTRDVLFTLPGKLRAAQAVFEETGGLHASGLFTAEGTLECVREDVGRHNAVDKVIGWALAEGRLPLSGSVLMVSGRASFELMQKAVAAGIPVLAAVSAPSSLAVQTAEAFGVTLVGFLRGESMNVYAHGERVAGAEPARPDVA